ncbi:MAG: HD-GYP domain-containing protein, partial [Desulfofundulus sp.]
MKISTKFLLPGMKLARPVYGKNGELLLKKGTVLTASYVMSLRRCGILAVDVDGLTDLSEEHRNLLEDEVRSDVMNVVRGWSQGEKRKGFERVVETVERIVDEILAGKEVVGNLTEICSADMYTYAHSV